MSRDITRIGVVGLGTMGAGIVEVFARSGYDVVGLDADEAAVARGQGHIEGLLVQLKNLSVTSDQQTKYIAILEKERDRLTALAGTQAKEREHYLSTINEQTAYIKALEAERTTPPRG